MSAAIMETQLYGLLTADPDLAARGCIAEKRTPGIAILRGGHHRGLWTWQGTLFAFTSGGSSAPNYEVETAVEALLHTRNVICPGK